MIQFGEASFLCAGFEKGNTIYAKSNLSYLVIYRPSADFYIGSVP